jgi:uncharacterized membrane protein
LGIPVAVLGLLAYLAVFLITLKRRAVQQALAFTQKDFFQYLLIVTIVMFLFQLYLTAAEVFFIHAYCIVCILSQLCTAALLWLVWKEFSSLPE